MRKRVRIRPEVRGFQLRQNSRRAVPVAVARVPPQEAVVRERRHDDPRVAAAHAIELRARVRHVPRAARDGDDAVIQLRVELDVVNVGEPLRDRVRLSPLSRRVERREHHPRAHRVRGDALLVAHRAKHLRGFLPPRVVSEGRGSVQSDDVGVEFKGVRSGVERRRGVSGLKPRCDGRRDAPGDNKVLKDRRSPRKRGRMGTNVQRPRLAGFAHVSPHLERGGPVLAPPERDDRRAANLGVDHLVPVAVSVWSVSRSAARA
eukprot:30837-Pelagococcus_subviridis.AAC.26